jgi:hypothetical protein
MHFGFLQNTSKLTTTPTNLLQIMCDSNPPNFTQKFQSNSLAAISSNTLQAPICQLWTVQCPAVLSFPLQP